MVKPEESPTLATDDVALLGQLLRNPARLPEFPPEQLMALLVKGALISLQEDGSPAAVKILAETAVDNPVTNAQMLAQTALAALASQGNEDAVETLFNLAIDQNQSFARELILQNGLHSDRAERTALVSILGGQIEHYRNLDPSYQLLTHAFLIADQSLQENILASAYAGGLINWADLAALAGEMVPKAADTFLDHYPTFKPEERALALRLLSGLAGDGSEQAQESLCQMFLRYEDQQARDAAVAGHFTPRDSIQRALFLFLTEQWQLYEVFDFDHRLLVTAYEMADNATRKRMLDLSRHSGQMDWFQSLSGANRKRWLGDLTDADWEIAIQRLRQSARWQDLWRLAQVSSPLWSAVILQDLLESGWQPAAVQDQEELRTLANLAKEARLAPLTIRSTRNFNIPGVDDLTALAINPDGKTLALGNSSNALHLWQISEIPTPLPTLFVSTSQTRSLGFSPDGEHLVAGMGDNSLRVYRLYDGREIKKLEGHTGLVRSLAFSPDSRTLYTGSFDGSLRAWRFPYGPEVKTFYRSQGEIFGLALSPDGDLLAAGGADRVVSVFRLPNGQLVHELEGHRATITNLTSAPDTEYVASSSRDGTIRIWNMLSGRSIQTIQDQQDVITGLCIHSNEQILISAGFKGKVTLFNISTGLPLYELISHRRAVVGLALTPDGSTLISASADGAVSLWNLEIFVQSRTPIEAVRNDRLNEIKRRLKSKALTSAEKKWLEFIVELLQWKQRFDVQIDSPQFIPLDDFDIQLE